MTLSPKKLSYTFIFYLTFFYSFNLLSAQSINTNKWQVDTLIIVDQPEYQFVFPDRHMYQPQSLRLFVNSQPLYEIQNYVFNEERAVQFIPSLNIGDSLKIMYQRLPFNLKSVYTLFNRDTLSAADSANVDSAQVRIVNTSLQNPFEDFGSGLQKSGSIMRGVNVGTNRDLTLNSGLNLELSGKLSDDVEIVAALSDESTPIQPEGNTQTLDEVDQVFIQFKSPYVDGTVGDFNLKRDGTHFSNFSRKLSGLTLLGKYEKYYAGVTIATTRGFFNRVSFIGQEGNQGPYQLTGKDGEREIIVLAGTENVWVNGRKILRGESNEYIIEYGDGQITFTNSMLITSESRIEVDFEYFPAIQKYSRTAFGGLGGGTIYENLKYNFSFYQEKDNTDQAIGEEENLSKEEIEILKEAGDDFTKAYQDGAIFTGDGKGNYIKVDTLYNNQFYEIYRFAGRLAGNYNVVFTSLGPERGSYLRDRLGQYRWVGPGRGSYEPLKLIPLPQLQQLTDINLQWNPVKDINIISEYALSNLDKNIYSSEQNNDNLGNAFTINATANNLNPKLFGKSLGSLDVSFNTRFIDENFQSLDRINDPDYQRYWNILSNQRINNQEESIQLNAKYKPLQEIMIGFNAGSLLKNDFRSFRHGTQLGFNKTNWFDSELNFEQVESTIKSSNTTNNWNRFNYNILKDVWYFQHQFLYFHEHRKNKTPLLINGFRFDDFGLKIALLDWEYLNGFTQFNERIDQVYDVDEHNNLVPQSTTKTKRFSIETSNINETSIRFEFINREKDYTSRFENIKLDSLKLLFADATVQDTVWQDRSTNLAELQINHERWNKALNANLQYRISTEQTALREKIYVKVEEGRGNLRYDEQTEEYVPDPDGDFILFILPSGKFEPVTNLESALRLIYDPSRYWRNPAGPWQNLLSNISGTSYFRVEEETKEENLQSVYFLNLSKFQQSKTLRGSMIYDQDIFIMKKNRQLNFRLNYRFRDDLFNQFLDADDNENKLTTEKGVRADWKINTELKSQSEASRKIIKRQNNNILRERDITAYLFSQRFIYNPFTSWEFRFNLEYGDENNKPSGYPLHLWFGIAKIEANYIAVGKGRITADYEHQVVNVFSNPLNRSVPFEMARGKKEGTSKKWQLRAEYTFSKNILFTFLYRGRDEAGFSEIIHTGQAEIRAFF
jgi:hypothetical protein